MAEIYTYPAQNLIWLGEDEEGKSEESIVALQAILADMRREAQDAAELCKLIWEPNGAHRFSNTPTTTQVDWSVISRFFGSPWFRRLWVVQEACLPRKSICFRGKSQIQMDDLMKAICWMYHKGNATDGDRGVDLRNFDCALSIFHLADEQCGGLRLRSKLPGRSLASRIFYVDVSTDAPTDVRDCIYGRLGLYQKLANIQVLPPGLMPDYSLSKEEVFHRAVRAVITLDHDLRILEETCLSANERDPCIPSWVPRWDMKSQEARA